MNPGPKPRNESDRFWEKVEKSDGCWLYKGQVVRHGYGSFSVGGHKSRKVYAHRFAYEESNGPLAPGKCVLHKCDTPLCVRPDHLFEGTKRDNTLDMVSKKRHGFAVKPETKLCGSRNHEAKLTDAQVDSLRAESTGLYGEQSRLAKKYNISRRQVGRILKGESWNQK